MEGLQQFSLLLNAWLALLYDKWCDLETVRLYHLDSEKTPH